MFEPMDIAINSSSTIMTPSSNPKSPPVPVVVVGSDEIETTTPTKIHHSTTHPSLSFSNGALKRHHAAAATKTKSASLVSYKECLKNHAASLGGHALDGCGEFMPSPTSAPTNPTMLKCAACGCHRNFHRRDPDDMSSPSPMTPPPISTRVIEYQPHHRHHPPPPPRGDSPSPHSPSPPPISSSYYPASAPHMLLALSAGLQTHAPAAAPTAQPPLIATIAGAAENSHMMRCGDGSGSSNGRKRFRTKFSQGQKTKMLEFAGRVGWKMMKRDEDVVGDFCNEIGVDRNVFKVWMHNNKSKSDHHQFHVNGTNNNTNGDDEDTNPHLATNGSSSSS